MSAASPRNDLRAQTTANPVNPLCTGCGACVAASGGRLEMGWNDYGFLVPRLVGDQVPNAAVQACPFNPSPAPEVRDEDVLAQAFLSGAPQTDPKIGRFTSTYIGYARQYRPTSSSGGLATYVFGQLLARGVVDHLLVVVPEGDGFAYQVLSRGDDMARLSKTRYYPVTMAGVLERLETLPGRVAISGVACFIKAIRLRQQARPELREKIAFLVGIICGGWKSRAFTGFLADSAGVQGRYTRPEYRIKDAASLSSDYAFSATDASGTVHQMKMATVGDMWGTGLFKARACDFCTDVLTELADISLGDAWLAQYRKDGLGNSVIVTRSALADQIVREGIAAGDLAASEAAPQQIIDSQRASFSHRRDAIGYRVATARRHGLPTPPIRARLLTPISLPYRLVQVMREVTRSRSLLAWRARPDAAAFNATMRRPLRLLHYATRLYHRLR